MIITLQLCSNDSPKPYTNKYKCPLIDLLFNQVLGEKKDLSIILKMFISSPEGIIKHTVVNIVVTLNNRMRLNYTKFEDN